MARALVLALVVAAAAALVPSGAGGQRSAPTPPLDRVGDCFRAKRVLVDPGGSTYLPARAAPRAQQLALSFALVRGELSPSAVVVVTASRAAGIAMERRLVSFLLRNSNATRTQVDRYVQRHGPAVLVWLASGAGTKAHAIVRRCLGKQDS